MALQPDSGYTFHESDVFPAGYERLDVRLTDHPGARYFDVHQVTLPLAGNHAVTPERISHPWRGPAGVRVGPGRIRLVSHGGEVDDAFTFGGRASFVVDEAETRLSLRSDVAIYHHGDDAHIASFNLVDELEALLALRQAHYAAHIADYGERLVAADPRALFVASLNALDEHVRSHRLLADDTRLHDVLTLISRTKHRLQLSGDWPDPPPRLEDIL